MKLFWPWPAESGPGAWTGPIKDRGFAVLKFWSLLGLLFLVFVAFLSVVMICLAAPLSLLP
jgi:hypothetical protein